MIVYGYIYIYLVLYTHISTIIHVQLKVDHWNTTIAIMDKTINSIMYNKIKKIILLIYIDSSFVINRYMSI